MVGARDFPDPAEPARAWCNNAIEGAWATDEVSRTIYKNVWSVTFRFERQEDAALFKLFWSEGA